MRNDSNNQKLNSKSNSLSEVLDWLYDQDEQTIINIMKDNTMSKDKLLKLFRLLIGQAIDWSEEEQDG